MGRNKLTIEQTRVKNLPYVDGKFTHALNDEFLAVIDKVSVATGKRGRKPVVFQASSHIGTLTLDPELMLSDAIDAIRAFHTGAGHE